MYHPHALFPSRPCYISRVFLLSWVFFFVFVGRYALRWGSLLCFAWLCQTCDAMQCDSRLASLCLTLCFGLHCDGMLCARPRSSPPLSRSLHPTLAPPSNPLSHSPVLSRPPPRRRACTWVHTCARVCTHTGLGMLAGVRASSSTHVHACARLPRP